MYVNYCMFDMTSQIPVQNRQSWKYSKLQNLQVWFLYDLEAKDAKNTRHINTHKIIVKV